MKESVQSLPDDFRKITRQELWFCSLGYRPVLLSDQYEARHLLLHLQNNQNPAILKLLQSRYPIPGANKQPTQIHLHSPVLVLSLIERLC